MVVLKEKMAFLKILPAGELPPGTLRHVEVEGLGLAVCNVEGTVYAMADECPHAGAPLGQGALHGHTIVCPWHAWSFDCRTGGCDFNSVKLETFPARVEDGHVWIDF